MMESNEKKLLRDSLLKQRRQLTTAEVQVGSRRIAEHLRAWRPLHKARVCMAFFSMPDEPQMDLVVQKLLTDGKTVCMPKLTKQYGWMDAAVIGSLETITIGRLGLRQPDDNCPLIKPDEIELVLVPGVAFDRSGARLGMGAGYYDRFLAQLTSAIFAGIAWDFQLLPDIPAEQHDISMQWLITENGVYDCIRGKI